VLLAYCDSIELQTFFLGGTICQVFNADCFSCFFTGQEGPIAQALYDLIFEDMRSGPPSVRIPVPY